MAGRQRLHAAADICECGEGSKPQLRGCLIHTIPSRGKRQSICVDVQAARALLHGRAQCPSNGPSQLGLSCRVAYRQGARKDLPGIGHPLQTEGKTRCETVDMRTNQLHMLTRYRMDL